MTSTSQTWFQGLFMAGQRLYQVGDLFSVQVFACRTGESHGREFNRYARLDDPRRERGLASAGIRASLQPRQV